ncbi:hypothetical protein CANARDRAFT_20033 [[Candida] arabinofermentans NRRL YB-2248]|uniref:Aminotransferase class III n=1 Tax=[Candida] arabinofermentans NRRL YB-2248 TaxID=983967 RepID=A0A1E4STN6_9ASCO|nr:hypothetical protein CANARDRAFT_20033 [[Candida] arabinofermentans NRRL YB-2248]
MSESKLFQRVVSKKAPTLKSASGLYMTYYDPDTKQTKTVLDAMTGAAVGSLGHCDEEIVKLMGDAAKTSNYSFGIFFSNDAAEELSNFIIEQSKPNHFSSCLWVSSGSEANENAIMTIRQYHIENNQPSRFKFISRVNSYHGFTTGALSLSDGSRKNDFKKVCLPENQSLKITSCVPFRRGLNVTEEEYTELLLSELEQCFIDNDPDTIAGVFIETVSGSSFGTMLPSIGYIDGVINIAHKYGALVCFDEIMVGLGRSGKYHCYENFTNLQPDLLTVGKTLASGYVTIAGLLISPKVQNVITNGSNMVWGTQTYHCHEFSCKVALAVQEKIKRDNLIETGKLVGEYMMNEFKSILKKSKIVGDVRGLPLFQSIEFCDPVDRTPFDPKLKVCYKVSEKALENGITTMPFQGAAGDFTLDDGKVVPYGDHISIAPAYIITKQDADKIVKCMCDAIFAVEAEILS